MASIYRLRVSGRLSNLHGLLAIIRDLGLPILSIDLLEPEPSDIEVEPEDSNPLLDSL